MGIVKRTSAFVRRVFPEKFLANVERKLLSTDIMLSVEEYVGTMLLAVIAICVALAVVSLFITFPLPIFLLIPLVAVLAFPSLALGVPQYLAQRRAAELERVLPDALRQMASTLRAGVSIEATLEDVVKSKYGPLSKEFERVVAEVRRGRSLENALLALSRRSGSLLYERAFNLIVEGIERGAALASVLDSVAVDIKEVHAIQRERKAATMQQVLFLLAVALFIVPLIVGLVVGISGKLTIAGGAPMPEVVGTIVAIYVAIQAAVCAFALSTIRYGKTSRGVTFLFPFVLVAVSAFYLAKFLLGMMLPI